MILPEVGALVTSFGRDSIISVPSPNATVLTRTNDFGHAEKLPPLLHNLLLPLVTNCKDVGQFEDVYGDIWFDPVTRSVDVQGTGIGIGEIVEFHL